MKTPKQDLGTFGEEKVARKCTCPRCKRDKTLRRLPANFTCADVICNFCGYLAQVKTHTRTANQMDTLPRQILGAAWEPQRERMEAGIYFPLFLVLVTPNKRSHQIHYLSADLQHRDMFKARESLSADARRAGWTGFYYDLESVRKSFVRLV